MRDSWFAFVCFVIAFILFMTSAILNTNEKVEFRESCTSKGGVMVDADGHYKCMKKDSFIP